MSDRSFQIHFGDPPASGEHAWRPIVGGRVQKFQCWRCRRGPYSAWQIAQIVSRHCYPHMTVQGVQDVRT